MAAGILTGACAQNDLLLYNSPTSIYRVTIPDSLIYTFATRPASLLVDTVNVQYRVIGTAAAIDRPIRLVPETGATAKEGYHYQIGRAVVNANEFATTVPIYLFRRAGLKDSIVNVILKIEANEHFELGYKNQLTYKLSIADILTKPNRWDATWAAYFGTYSEVKFRFLISVTGKSDWEATPFPQDSRYLAQRARNALLEYVQQNGPLIDEFGDEVFFP